MFIWSLSKQLTVAVAPTRKGTYHDTCKPCSFLQGHNSLTEMAVFLTSQELLDFLLPLGYLSVWRSERPSDVQEQQNEQDLSWVEGVFFRQRHNHNSAAGESAIIFLSLCLQAKKRTAELQLKWKQGYLLLPGSMRIQGARTVVQCLPKCSYQARLPEHLIHLGISHDLTLQTPSQSQPLDTLRSLPPAAGWWTLRE